MLVEFETIALLGCPTSMEKSYRIGLRILEGVLGEGGSRNWSRKKEKKEGKEIFHKRSIFTGIKEYYRG